MKSNQAKKRIIVDVTPKQHDELKDRAIRLGLTLSNMVRRALMIPEDSHGRRYDIENKSK